MVLKSRMEEYLGPGDVKVIVEAGGPSLSIVYARLY